MKIFETYSPDAEIVLFNGMAENFISTIPKGSVNLVMSSPPYNVGKEYEQIKDLNIYLEQQKPIISQIHNVLSDRGSVCWQVGNYVSNGEVYPLDIFYYNIFKSLGFALRNRIIWHYGHGLHASSKFSGRYETILWFTKSDDYVFNLDSVRVPAKYPGKRYYKGPQKGKPSGNPKGKNPSDVWQNLSNEWEEGFWQIPNVKANHIEKTQHPCQFPVELVERCVLALTNEPDWILDPFAGVGSTIIAGIKHRRRVIGCEKEGAYVNIAKQRIENFFNGSLKLRPLGKAVYEPGNEKVARIPEEWQELAEPPTEDESDNER